MGFKKHLIDVFGKVGGVENTLISTMNVGEEIVIQFSDTEGLHLVRISEEQIGLHIWEGTPDNIVEVCLHANGEKVMDGAGHIDLITYTEDYKAIKNEDSEEVAEETYNDYPQSASNNAKKALRWREEHGRDEVKGGTRVGWQRANQLANREKISRETIGRMAAFKRHEKNSKVDPKFKATPWKDKGYVAWLLWGGTSGVNWAIRKKESIDRQKKNK